MKVKGLRLCDTCSRLVDSDGLTVAAVDYCAECSAALKRWWLEHDGAPYHGESKESLRAIFAQWASERGSMPKVEP